MEENDIYKRPKAKLGKEPSRIEKYKRARPHWLASTFEILAFLSCFLMMFYGFWGLLYTMMLILAAEFVMFRTYIGALLVIGLLLFLVNAHQILPYVLLTGDYHGYIGPLGYAGLGALGTIAVIAQYLHQRDSFRPNL